MELHKYKKKWYKCSELAKIAKCSYETMKYRVKHMTVDEAVSLGKNGGSGKRKEPLRKCKCGCGEDLYVRNQIFFDYKICRPIWVKKGIASGEIQPVSKGKCLNPECGKEILRYNEIKSSLTKDYCNHKCGRRDQDRKVDRKALAQKINKEAAASGVTKHRNPLAKKRDIYCIRDNKKCELYDNWLEFPGFNCECTGYKATENHGASASILAINYNTPSVRKAVSSSRRSGS